MNKKLFAALTASLMLCGMLTAPVSAAETDVKMGDVNLDGVVDVADAQLTLQEYVMLVLSHHAEGILTPEQRQLALIIPPEYREQEYITDDNRSLLLCAQTILEYYCAHLVNPDITLEQTVGRELEVDIAFKEFIKQYSFVFDEQTNSYVKIEKQKPE